MLAGCFLASGKVQRGRPSIRQRGFGLLRDGRHTNVIVRVTEHEFCGWMDAMRRLFAITVLTNSPLSPSLIAGKEGSLSHITLGLPGKRRQ